MHINIHTNINASYNSDHIDVLKLLIENGGDVFHVDNSGNTCLFHAGEAGNLEIVKLFIEKGVDPNKCTKGKDTPLIVAAKQVRAHACIRAICM